MSIGVLSDERLVVYRDTVVDFAQFSEVVRMDAISDIH